MLPLLQKSLLLFLIFLLVGCQTAEENGNQEIVPTVVPTLPSVATVESQTQETAETAAPVPTEMVATPTTPPELIATEVPVPQAVVAIQLAPVASGFEKPTFLTHAGDGRLFVTEQVGRIRIIENGQLLPTPFLDIQAQIGSESSEQGLLSMAFHPNYLQNGRFFVDYTDLAGNTVLSRFQVNVADPYTADPASEQILLTVNQPFPNHNGGQLQFGPDGYLYMGMGDGGSGGDPQNNGQNPATLLGALLRIDVDGGTPYAIPGDNPFANDPDRAAEIWAYGLRNPWRFSFDRLTGDLYVADVGQNAWEEVNFQPAQSNGGQNYGWNIMESSHCYEAVNCDSDGLVLPVAEYSHDASCSITGGYVYRGSQYPALTANYFFADYCSGIIWSLFHQQDGSWVQAVVLESGRTISSFGDDAAGELYVVAHGRGEILQIQSTN
ncbi:MAG: PQQ-dependent sugar dehydrogenase [Candidatus Promineifilaceae bacterium]